MRRAPFLALILLAAISLSCGDAPTAVSDDSVMAFAAEAQLSPTLLLAKNGNAATIDWRPFAFTILGCDELVDVQGFSHNLSKDQVRGKTGSTSFLKVSAQGFGVGKTSHAKYVFSDKISYSQVGESGQVEFLGASRQFKLIGQGGVPNLQFYGVVNFTVGGDGNLSIEIDQAHQICK
ncbi:MAG: hypothetical protein MUO50_07885 [Longimicrobiales bacterium]|nr:hypothetical protein [Longimicrobiales bacterium]